MHTNYFLVNFWNANMYLLFYYFFTILGSSSGQKVGSYFRNLSTWKKSKTDGFNLPYRVTNDSWVDDISKSVFNFKMNIFLIQKRNQSAIFWIRIFNYFFFLD